MIQESRLRKNSWVSYFLDEVKVMGKVDALNQTGVRVFDHSGIDGFFYYEDIYPISITEDMLINSKFERVVDIESEVRMFIKIGTEKRLFLSAIGTSDLIMFFATYTNKNEITGMAVLHDSQKDGEMYIHDLQGWYLLLSAGEELDLQL